MPPQELEKIIKEKDSDLDKAISEVKAYTKKSKKRKKKVPPAQIVNQKLRELERAKQAHQKALDEYYDYMAKERKKLEGQKDTLSNLASLGVLTVSFGHEIRTHSALALTNAKLLTKVVKKSERTGESLDYAQLDSLTSRMVIGAQYVDTFSQLAINNIKPDKRKRKKKYLYQRCSGVFLE